jgi:hypothetical protein
MGKGTSRIQRVSEGKEIHTKVRKSAERRPEGCIQLRSQIQTVRCKS